MAVDLRRSTVYDFSDLRLHRDGTRVHQTDRNYVATSSRKPFMVKDAQGNWTAEDAGGLGIVPRTKYAHYDTDSAGVDDLERGEGQGQRPHAKKGRISRGERDRVQPLDYRTLKRWRFEESLDFLDEMYDRNAAAAPGVKGCLPVPSSELLKNIHYIAAEFYTERGQLLNLAKKYRAEKKRKWKGKNAERTRKRRRVDGKSDTGATRRKPPNFDDDEYEASCPSDSDSRSDCTSLPKDDGDGKGSEPSGDTPSTSELAKTRKKRYTYSLREIRQKHQQDMYRVMDGSALMVLGMLVQEHVAKIVQGGVPEGWEEGLALGEEEDSSEEWWEQEDNDSASEEGEDIGEDDDIESGIEDNDGGGGGNDEGGSNALGPRQNLDQAEGHRG